MTGKLDSSLQALEDEEREMMVWMEETDQGGGELQGLGLVALHKEGTLLGEEPAICWKQLV